ncbi:hypothetical protein J1N35_044525 [Gossypium stocksii]|uniref:Uncharacterized protein n=1 Tax=Gossypium stocksii TaxID=47602 RepID=A0A9D3U971_9ROSI|nr:hypothetical protein J1N35_044525 [Gossypium stocksii]
MDKIDVKKRVIARVGPFSCRIKYLAMFPKPHCYDLILHRKIGMNMQTKHKKKARKHDSKLKCRSWKGVLEEIRKEQNSIREGQSQVGEKLEAMEIEYEALHEESKLMIERSALTQIRLAVMLNILTARKEGDYAMAAHFTQLLREIIAKDNMQQQQTLRRN